MVTESICLIGVVKQFEELSILAVRMNKILFEIAILGRMMRKIVRQVFVSSLGDRWILKMDDASQCVPRTVMRGSILI